jgi:ankyrin repeat protein
MSPQTRFSEDLQATPRQRAQLLAALLDGDLPAFKQLQRLRGGQSISAWCGPTPLFHAAILGAAPTAAVEAVSALLAAEGSGPEFANIERDCLAGAIASAVQPKVSNASLRQQLQVLISRKSSRCTAAHLAAALGKHDCLRRLLAEGNHPPLRTSSYSLALAACEPISLAEQQLQQTESVAALWRYCSSMALLKLTA